MFGSQVNTNNIAFIGIIDDGATTMRDVLINRVRIKVLDNGEIKYLVVQ
jgi:hypothetical protein